MTNTATVPGSIVKAICAIQETLESVKKSQKNNHDGYFFSSTDDIYAALTQKMGKVGLLCLCLESETEIQRHQNKQGVETPWLRVTFNFVLATQDDTWSDPNSKRTILVRLTGPQTFQAAQSFAEKAYLRSLFKIPTGDMDLDALPADYEYSPIFSQATTPPTPPAPPAQANDAPTEAFDGAAFLASLEDDLACCQTLADLDEISEESKDAIENHLTEDQKVQAWGLFEENQSRIGKSK